MADEVNGNGTVRYTIKELLEVVRSDIAQIDKKLDLKANQIDLLNVSAQVTNLGARVAHIETEQAKKEAVDQNKRWLIGTVLFASLGTGTVSTTLFLQLVGVL